MVSYRVKKKLDNRTCQYCKKEFRYPCRLKQHYKTVKCSDSISSQINQCSDSISQINKCSDSISSQINKCSDSISSRINKCSDSISSQINLYSDSEQEKNTVPIHLSLA